jgi:hypothetical protein
MTRDAFKTSSSVAVSHEVDLIGVAASDDVKRQDINPVGENTIRPSGFFPRGNNIGVSGSDAK